MTGDLGGLFPHGRSTRGAGCWDDARRRHVEADLFRATADTLLVSNLDINNHQTWFNAGLMSIASVLGDRELVEKVLTMRGGYRDHQRAGVAEERKRLPFRKELPAERLAAGLGDDDA